MGRVLYAVLSLSDLRDYVRITSEPELRFGDALLPELLHDQLHNQIQQTREDLTTLVYGVQSFAKRAFIKRTQKIEAATKATRITRRLRSVEEDDEVEVKATLFAPRKRGTFHRNLPVRTALEGIMRSLHAGDVDRTGILG
nr:unnamed protein product [Callosobruchus chinensis]